MAANLTAGAIAKMLNGEVTTEEEMMPILQVTELKLFQQARKNQESMERYKLSLSDGIQSQEGILNTNWNLLVKQGKIQVGSVLRLTRFVCNNIQIRRITIVIELEIIAEECSIIGNPLPAQPGKPRNSGQASTNQTQQHPGVVSVNTQSIGGFEQQQGRSELNNGTVRHGGFEQQQGRMSEPNGAVRHGVANLAQHQERRAFDSGSEFPETAPSVRPFVSSNAGYGISMQERHNVANSPQPQVGEKRAFGTGSGFPETAPPVRPFVSANAGYGSSRQEQARAPPSAYSRPAVQPQPPSMYANMGPVARNEAPLSIFPIASLNPYQGRWTIKVRVTSKGELRRFNSTRGEGKVFSFDLVDAAGGEIRVTCFNDVVDKFFDMIVAGNVYLITKGNLKPARKEYNHLPNDYEIHLDNASTIQQCYEDDAAIPRNQFHFREICAIESMESNSIIDVIGIVSSISPTGTIMRKNGTEAQKRALQLKDMSGRSVEVTMWGNFCNAEGHRLQSICDSGVFPVLAVKAGRISEFNGKQVSTIGSSQLVVEPDLPEARELRAWYEREGRNAPCISISREFTGRQEARKVITQIKDENLGTLEKPDWITVSATISFMKVENFCYTACPNINGDRPCSKKVTNNGDGTWRCEKCDKCVDECDYRYILQLQLQDHTGVTWATAFQEAGEEIMGIPAKDLYYMKNEDRDEEKFEDIVRKAAFTKYIFKLKIKEETFSDESRVKATVVKAEKLDYSSDTRSLLEAMNKLRTEDANPLTINPESSNFRSGAFNSSNGTRENSSVDVPRREFGLPAGNQVNQFGNQHSSDSRPLGGVTLCDACGSSDHVFANCPSFLSEPQGQHMNNAYGNTPGRNAGGGMPRQHVGSY